MRGGGRGLSNGEAWVLFGGAGMHINIFTITSLDSPGGKDSEKFQDKIRLYFFPEKLDPT